METNQLSRQRGMGSCQAEKSGESTTGRRSSICKMHGEMKPCRELRGWEELQEVRLGTPVEMRWLNAAGRIPGYRVWIYCLVDTEEPLSIFKQAGNLISFFFFNHSGNTVWETKKGGSIHSFIPRIYIEHGHVLGTGLWGAVQMWS